MEKLKPEEIDLSLAKGRQEGRKLVVDIIGDSPDDRYNVSSVQILTEPQFQIEGGRKAVEESEEFNGAVRRMIDDPSRRNLLKMVEEAGDVLGVIEAVLRPYGFGVADIIAAMQIKQSKKGGYDKRYFMRSVLKEKEDEEK